VAAALGAVLPGPASKGGALCTDSDGTNEACVRHLERMTGLASDLSVG
jgi:hypothetical protein